MQCPTGIGEIVTRCPTGTGVTVTQCLMGCRETNCCLERTEGEKPCRSACRETRAALWGLHRKIHHTVPYRLQEKHEVPSYMALKAEKHVRILQFDRYTDLYNPHAAGVEPRVRKLATLSTLNTRPPEHQAVRRSQKNNNEISQMDMKSNQWPV